MGRFYVLLATFSCVALLHADTWNKKTVVTFPQKVEIPGAVLDPGKYVFKLADSPSNRHIVQVMNERENQVYATILAIPNYRMHPPDKTIMTFYEMPGGQPQALRSWFYPGDNYGQEFAYPKNRAVEIAKVTNVEVPPAPPAESESTTEAAVAGEASAPAAEPQRREKAEPQPQERKEEPAKSTEIAPAAKPGSEAAPEKAGEEKIPKTASDLPLLVVIGLGSLAAAAVLRIGARRAA